MEGTILLIIDHDATSAEVADLTVRALKEASLHIGKADRGFGANQIAAVEAAIAELQNALRLQKQRHA